MNDKEIAKLKEKHEKIMALIMRTTNPKLQSKFWEKADKILDKIAGLGNSE